MEVVQPTRTPEELKSYPGLAERWWQFWTSPDGSEVTQLRAISAKCIVFAKAAKYQISFVAPSDWIYTNKIILVAMDRPDLHVLFLGSAFQSWLHNFSVQSLGADNKTTSLSISKAFWTFPMPDAVVGGDGLDAAIEFQALVEEWSRTNHAGMTDAMNAVHSASADDDAIVRMRRLGDASTDVIAGAYDWSDLDLAHDFHEDGRRR